jgi:ABC-type phosphate transport system substrate-binding protein
VTRRWTLCTVALAAALVALTACAGGSASPAGSTLGTAATTATGAAQPAGAKLNANTASRAELEAALAAAGVPNASRWAAEVMDRAPGANPNVVHSLFPGSGVMLEAEPQRRIDAT